MPEFPVLDRGQILDAIDTGWREFRAQVRHVGRHGMDERTSTGWTYKDLVGHVAAWEEEATRRLRVTLRGGEVAEFGGDAVVDAFNARAVDERRLVGAEAILDELDSAHRTLVTLVGELPPAVLADPRVQRWIGANTFGHYAEHREELSAARGV